MAYTPTNWQDLPSKQTLVTAARLNNMESGIVSGNQTATQSRQGQMTASDKTKLDGLYAPVIAGTQIEF